MTVLQPQTPQTADTLQPNSINHSESTQALNPVILVAEQGVGISTHVIGLVDSGPDGARINNIN